MLTPRAAVLTDAVANLGGAALTALSPQLWAALGLPEPARRPVAVALVASGLLHVTSAASSTPTSGQLRAGATVNAGWVLAGLSAQALPLNRWQRALLLTIAGYDTAMTAVKARASEPAR